MIYTTLGHGEDNKGRPVS